MQKNGTQTNVSDILSAIHTGIVNGYPIWHTNLILVKFFDELIALIEKGVFGPRPYGPPALGRRGAVAYGLMSSFMLSR